MNIPIPLKNYLFRPALKKYHTKLEQTLEKLHRSDLENLTLVVTCSQNRALSWWYNFHPALPDEDNPLNYFGEEELSEYLFALGECYVFPHDGKVEIYMTFDDEGINEYEVRVSRTQIAIELKN